MSAFLDGFFSVFRVPFCAPSEIPQMDWGVDLSSKDWQVIKPAGDIIIEPPSVAASWKKVGNYLRNAMTEYEHNIQQQGNNGTVEHDGTAHPADVP